jgi:hypothetical protein
MGRAAKDERDVLYVEDPIFDGARAILLLSVFVRRKHLELFQSR